MLSNNWQMAGRQHQSSGEGRLATPINNFQSHV
uniref:Uncharacterized protein n=1 Tax=Arundo donax TaxID=35708 RepID=A0A0A9FL53_ARUDO